MKEENEITQEVKELLDSLEQHGQNARRQKELSDLIDSLATDTSLRGASATKQSTVDDGGLPRRSASSAPRNDVPDPASRLSIKSLSSFCLRAFCPCCSRLSSNSFTSWVISFSSFMVIPPYFGSWRFSMLCKPSKG